MNARQRRAQRREVKKLVGEMRARIEANPLMAKVRANMRLVNRFVQVNLDQGRLFK